MGKKVLVTGADGFIGSNIVAYLLSVGAKVTALIRPNSRLTTKPGEWKLINLIDAKNINLVWGDIRDISILHEAVSDNEIIFHLAAQTHVPLSQRMPIETFLINALGTLHLAEIAKDHGKPLIVYPSSDKVYGVPKQLPLVEESPFLAHSPYDVSKSSSEQLLLSYHYSYDLPVILLRLTNVYGPHQSLEKVVAHFVNQALVNKSISINGKPGDKFPSRDFIFVDDVISAFFMSIEKLEKANGVPINIGTGIGTDIETLAKKICELTNARVIYRKGVSPREIFEEYVRVDLAKEILGWQAEIPLMQGLKKTIEWQKNNHGF